MKDRGMACNMQPFCMLHHLISSQAQNLQQSDLEHILGSGELAAKIVNGECAIAREQASKP